MKFLLGNSLSLLSSGKRSPVKKRLQPTLSNSTDDTTASPTVSRGSGAALARPSCAITEPSLDVKAVKTLLEHFQPSGFKGVDSFVSFFESPDAVFSLDDHPDIPCGALAAVLAIIHECLPDCRFECKRIYQGDEPNIVVMDGHKFSGTHTGAPYTFMPGKLPAIPASGKRVENDEERMYFTMNADHKITHIALIAMGPHTGPAGIYLGLGGTIDEM